MSDEEFKTLGDVKRAEERGEPVPEYWRKALRDFGRAVSAYVSGIKSVIQEDGAQTLMIASQLHHFGSPDVLRKRRELVESLVGKGVSDDNPILNDDWFDELLSSLEKDIQLLDRRGWEWKEKEGHFAEKGRSYGGIYLFNFVARRWCEESKLKRNWVEDRERLAYFLRICSLPEDYLSVEKGKPIHTAIKNYLKEAKKA